MSVQELATRLSLHPNTLRPQLRRLEEAGLVASETKKGTGAGRPQTLYLAIDVQESGGHEFRLLAEILSGLVTGSRQLQRAEALAKDWGAYLAARAAPRPGSRTPPGPNLAVLQEALTEAGFTPRFRRRGRKAVDITLRECPFRDLLDDHRDLVCAVHRGLLAGVLGGSRPALRMESFEPLADRGSACSLTARAD